MERRRMSGPDDDFTSQLGPLVEDDKFLTELSQGIDPTDGSDDLAALLLELRSDVERQMPPAPKVEGADEESATVIPMGARRRPRPLLHGLVGAAAATVLIAGSGAVLAGAGVFGGQTSNDPTVVELAGTLDELDSRTAEGDFDGARELLDEARRLVGSLDAANNTPAAESTTGQRSAPNSRQAPAETVRETVTVTETAAPARSSEPAAATTVTAPAETVTESAVVTETNSYTATQWATVTETIVRDNPLTPPTGSDDEPSNPGGGGGGDGLAPPQGQQ